MFFTKFGHPCMLSHLVMSNSYATPWTVACQVPLSMEFSRQEYWSGLPFFHPGDLPDPGTEHAAPALAGGFFGTEPPGKPHRPNCIPHKDANVQFAVPMKVTDFGNRIFVGDQVEMRSLGWALTQYDWCPNKKGRLHTDRQAT